MLFNSYIFIFLLLPMALLGYYGLNHIQRYEFANVWLIMMSLWFYGFFNPSYLIIIISSVVVNYLCYLGMHQIRIKSQKESQEPHLVKLVLIAGLLFNLGLIFYYKYTDFFLSTLNTVFQQNYLLRHIVLPLGISFFTFQQISFIVDAYKGEAEEFTFTEYALFVTFFPQLIAGPIVLHTEMIPQFRDTSKKKCNTDYIMRGIVIFIIGLFKKVIIADTFGGSVTWGYSNVAMLDSGNALLLMIFYAIQLYFDFSGYCDMARGLGWMFHMDIPVNFNSPYKAVDFIDFWKRWHITLNRFMTKYVYIPLGGNRKGIVRTYINLFMIFFVSGIWHGAGWTYITWGIISGILFLLNRLLKKWIDKVPKRISTFFTFLLFNFSIIYFRAQSVGQANDIMRRIVSFRFGKILPELMSSFNLDEFWYIIKVLHLDGTAYSQYYLGILFTILILIIIFFAKNAGEIALQFKPKIWNAVALSVMFLWSLVSLSGVSTFLYFNF